jgi:hydroxymethylbilane synthase
MSANHPRRLVIATRKSQLALWQAEHVREKLRALYPGMAVEILGLTTTGDKVLDSPLAKIGGKGLFVKELEHAMQRGEADFAVHSMKDVPVLMPPQFSIACIGEREDARDAFVSNEYADLGALPDGAVVGTSSLRRESQIRHHYPKLRIVSLRGNVQTRLKKLDLAEYKAIILAAAGLKRLGLSARIRSFLSPEASLPAVGQGALAVEHLSEREDVARALAPLADATTSRCIAAERSLSARLAGSCNVPLGAHATISADLLTLHAFVAAPDGSRLVRDVIAGAPEQAERLGAQLAERLLRQGAQEILAALESQGANEPT